MRPCVVNSNKCSKKYNFNKHLLTQKHIKRTNDDQTEIKSNFYKSKNKENLYICKCGKQYKYKQGLYRHINNNCNKSKYEDMKKTHQRAVEALNALNRIKKLSIIEETELIAEELRLASKHISNITSLIDNEDILDKIFSSFCIGK